MTVDPAGRPPEIREVAVMLPPEDIFYVSWTLDAYEGIGFMRTDDPQGGRATIFCPEEALGEVFSLLDALSREGVALEYRLTETRT